MNPDKPRTLIGPLVAAILYALLIVFAVATLKGKALTLAVIIVLGLAAKSLLDHFRSI